MAEAERAHKVLARLGVGSRRVCEDLIREGRVTINGRPASLGDKVTEDDELAVDGSVLSTKPDAVTYLLNKPVGVVSTASDPQGRQTVVDMVPADRRVYPVGRLDMDTEGLLLLTNDGDLANRLTHPRYGVDKEYIVHVEGRPGRGALRKLREGVELDDGITAPAQASAISPGVIKLVIHEGRNRQVRRMCDAVGHPVIRLVRSRIGPIVDRHLKPGQSRRLSEEELLALQRAVGQPEPSTDDNFDCEADNFE